MYIITNEQREEIIRYLTAYRQGVDLERCDMRTRDMIRRTGNLLKSLKARQPLRVSDLPAVKNRLLRKK